MPWIPTIPTSALDGEGLARARAGETTVALYQSEGAYFATADMCTHGLASLADGYLEGFTIECPLHQGTFDIRTGEAVDAPCTVAVRTFPVKVVDGVIHVEIIEGEVA